MLLHPFQIGSDKLERKVKLWMEQSYYFFILSQVQYLRAVGKFSDDPAGMLQPIDFCYPFVSPTIKVGLSSGPLPSSLGSLNVFLIILYEVY